MEQEKGKIKNITNNKIIIQMEVGAQCNSCEAKHSCCLTDNELIRNIEIPITNYNHNLKIGDAITLLFKPKYRIISAFLMFILPIFMLILGYFIGFLIFKSENMSILTALTGLFFSFGFLWIINKILKKNKDFLPIISKVS